MRQHNLLRLSSKIAQVWRTSPTINLVSSLNNGALRKFILLRGSVFECNYVENETSTSVC